MAKYDSLRKTDRDKVIIEFRRTHPELTLKDIGRSFNICSERVRQIIRAQECSVK